MQEIFFEKRNVDAEVMSIVSIVVKESCVFGRTVQLILALGPYIGNDDMLHFAFPTTMCSTTM